MLSSYLWVSWIPCIHLSVSGTNMGVEVNPQLFDDCTHEYGAQQNAQAQKQSDRKARWDRLEQLATTKKTPSQGGATTPSARLDEGDPLENQRRMEALRLQDDPHRSSTSVSE